MHYGKIKKLDIADGPGVRVSLFVSGCRNHCQGCFQPQTWDFNYGEEYTLETENEILNLLSPDYISGLTLLGGDPFEPENQGVLYRLLLKIRDKYGSSKSVWVYTGYTYEQLIHSGSHPNCDTTEKLLSLIDVLVDGPFIEAEKNLALVFRGSSNQRIIDIASTLKSNGVVLKSIE